MGDHRSPVATRVRSVPAHIPTSTLICVCRMSALWAVLGAVTGLTSLSTTADGVALIASMIAGVIVLTPYGLVLGLAGGRTASTCWGVCCGASMGMLASMAGSPGVLPIMLIAGGTAGATVPLAKSGIFSLRRFLLPAARPRRQAVRAPSATSKQAVPVEFFVERHSTDPELDGRA